MRVRLLYTVELDEMFDEVSRLLDRCTKNISEKCESLKFHTDRLSGNNTQAVSKAILELREELLKRDSLLEECNEILRSYEEYIQRNSQDPTGAENEH
tara:strand:- start:1940 stop:2233 length:294 start_codon:yes stop_codon:yes gene_type:complete